MKYFLILRIDLGGMGCNCGSGGNFKDCFGGGCVVGFLFWG